MEVAEAATPRVPWRKHEKWSRNGKNDGEMGENYGEMEENYGQK